MVRPTLSRWRIVAFVGASIALSTGQAFAAAPTIDGMTGLFETFAAGIGGGFLTAGRTLFWMLAALELAAAMAMQAFKSGGVTDIFVELTKRVVSLGFFTLILENYSGLASGVIEWWRIVGNDAVGAAGGSQMLSPADMVVMGKKIVAQVMNTDMGVGVEAIGKWLLLSAIAIVTLVLWAALAMIMILALIEAWFVIAVGNLFGGFAGSGFTKDIAFSAWKAPLASAAKLLGVQMCVGIGENLFKGYIAALETTTGDEFFNYLIELTMCSLMYAGVVAVIPQRIANMVGGGSFSGNPLANAVSGTMKAAGGAAAAAGGVALGGAMLAHQATSKAIEGQRSSGQSPSIGGTIKGAASTIKSAALQDVGDRLAGRARSGSMPARMGMNIKAQRDADALRSNKPTQPEAAPDGQQPQPNHIS